MANEYKLFNELNQTKHVCLFSQNACLFCRKTIHKRDEPSIAHNTIYIAPFEVVLHNRPNDIWVSFLGKVYDLTPLIEKHKGERCILPLLAFAGKDLSHWFNEHDQDIQHYIHPVTGVRVPYCPYGPLPEVHQQVPTSAWKELEDKPWWTSDTYFKGYLTKRVRAIRVQNMLSRNVSAINVCMEDPMMRILQRYLLFNTDADSYTWRYEDRCLDMNKTLEENGIPDERNRFASCGLPENTYVPMLLLYYNDDLKWE